MEGGVKIVFLGDSGVGKTTIITKYVTGSVPEVTQQTVGAAFFSKSAIIDKKQYNLLIWDTAGQELYRGLAPMYYRNASIAIITFDLTKKSSFDAVTYWLKEIREKSEEENVVIIVCGNKCDLEGREIENGEKFAVDNGLLYCETSATTGSGIDRLFQMALLEYEKKEGTTENKETNVQTVDIKVEPTKEKKGCC